MQQTAADLYISAEVAVIRRWQKMSGSNIEEFIHRYAEKFYAKHILHHVPLPVGRERALGHTRRHEVTLAGKWQGLSKL